MIGLLLCFDGVLRKVGSSPQFRAHGVMCTDIEGGKDNNESGRVDDVDTVRLDLSN
jgi:hypothetical protein